MDRFTIVFEEQLEGYINDKEQKVPRLYFSLDDAARDVANDQLDRIKGIVNLLNYTTLKVKA